MKTEMYRKWILYHIVSISSILFKYILNIYFYKKLYGHHIKTILHNLCVFPELHVPSCLAPDVT